MNFKNGIVSGLRSTAERGQNSAQGADFEMVPARLGQHAAKRPAGCLGARLGEEIALGCKHALEMRHQPVEIFLRGGGQEVFLRGLDQLFVLRPFIGAQDHRLRQVQRSELRVDRHGQNLARERDIVGFQARSFGTEHIGAATRRTMDFARRFVRRDHGLGDAALAHGGRIDMRAIRDRIGQRLIDLRAVQHDVRARRRRPGIGIGPAVARAHQPHLGQPEIQHGPRRLADILAQLAQARYLSANRVIDAQTRSLLERSLAVNPQQGTALGVLGIDAFAAGDYLNAITYWQRLQMGLDPQTGEAMVIAAGLNEAKRLAIEAGSIEGLQLNVDIAPALGDFPNGVLFVVVREPSGSPMPVAAVRLPVRAGTAAFPLTVYVTDSDVIRQGATLSDFDSLRVSAHISVKGVAMRSPGDWVSEAAMLRGDATSQPVSLLIDQLQPATR